MRMEGRARGGGLINFPPLKKGGLIGEAGAYLRGGLNRGFTLYQCISYLQAAKIDCGMPK